MAGRGAGHDRCRSRRRSDGSHHLVDDRRLDAVVRDRGGVRASGVVLRVLGVLPRCDVRVRPRDLAVLRGDLVVPRARDASTFKK